jgi:hypothetical protein
MCRQIGPAARLVRCSEKIDDAALIHGLDRGEFDHILRCAWRIK